EGSARTPLPGEPPMRCFGPARSSHEPVVRKQRITELLPLSWERTPRPRGEPLQGRSSAAALGSGSAGRVNRGPGAGRRIAAGAPFHGDAAGTTLEWRAVRSGRSRLPRAVSLVSAAAAKSLAHARRSAFPIRPVAARRKDRGANSDRKHTVTPACHCLKYF